MPPPNPDLRAPAPRDTAPAAPAPAATPRDTAPAAPAPATPRATAPATPRATAPATPRATAPATPRATAPATPRATAPATPRATAPATPRATAQPTRRPGHEPSRRHHIAVLALGAVVPLDLAIPAQVFGNYPEAPYRLTVCAATPGPVATSAGFAVVADAGLEALAVADTVLVPGFIPHLRIPPEPVLDALRAAHARGARMISICTGAFALAAADVLDGRRATTHWRDAADLAARHPRVRVEPGVLYIDEGEILTSAGVAAGLDLCLYILRRDHGAALANRIARRIVVPPHRDGGQAQYVEQPVPEQAGGSLAGTRAWALERLHEPLTVRTLATHAHVSERTFARRFTSETGVPVLRWLHAQRIDAARTALEATEASIDDIAHRCGFGTAANLRKHFHRHLSTTPTAYRRAFAS